MSFQDLLKSWGLEKYIEKFEEEEIDDDNFRVLEVDEIRRLIPKLGPYSTFLKKYREWNSQCPTAASESNVEVRLPLDTAVYTVRPNGELRRVDEKAAPATSVTGEQEKEVGEQREVEVTTPPANSADAAASNAEINDSFPFIKEGPVYEAVCKLYHGTLAVEEYKRKCKLSPQSQQGVAKSVINIQFGGNLNKKITRERFLELAEKIEAFFPGERKETYYTPFFVDEAGAKHAATGKLTDLYYNVRKRGVKGGSLERRKGRSKSLETEADVSQADDTTEEADPDVINKINSLMITATPWQSTVEKWTETHTYRMAEVRTPILRASKRQKGNAAASARSASSEALTASTYMKKYRGLREHLGFTLLELDYSLLYPNTEENLMFFWADFKIKVIEALRTRWPKGSKKQPLEADCSDAEVLMNLSHLLKPKLIQDKTPWKPTREVMQEGFMVHITDASDIKPAVKRLKDEATGRKHALQRTYLQIVRMGSSCL